MKTKPTCPHCGEEINLNSIRAKYRWANTTKKERRAYSVKLHKAKADKKFSTDQSIVLCIQHAMIKVQDELATKAYEDI